MSETAAAIPLLIKAVDFLFDEGKRYLENRRKGKETGQIQDKEVNDEISKISETVAKTPRADLILSKEDAKKDKINESLWLKSEEKVKHLTTLLEIYSKNYYLASEQKALWGNALVPPIVIHNLDEAEKSLTYIIKQLEAILSEIYGKKVIAEYPGSGINE